MNDIEMIKTVVLQYCNAISSQDREAFLSLWSGDENDTLISIAKKYCGAENIYNDFLIGGIQNAYTQIKLIADSEPQVSFTDDTTAVVVFEYHTECIRRDDGSAYGIEGIETQIMVKTGDNWRLRHIHYSKK